MWKESDPDPGGTSQKGAPGHSPENIADLKDQNEQQKLLIAQLKEMLRKEQSSVTQEKVEEYVNTLSKVKAKKTRAKRDESGSVERSASSTSIDIIKKGKLNLLRQQLEENKAKLAERGKNQKGIEEMVTQLKAQLNDSQQLINLSPASLPDPKNLEYSKNSTPEELYNILLTKEKRITDLMNNIQKQEASVLDLQENLKEKDSVIDARTKAITLMTESLSKKGKTTLDELDDTKEQMKKMQEHFVNLETEMKARQVKLLNDLKAKNLEITELQEEKYENLKTIEKYKTTESGSVEHDVKTLQEKLDEMKVENEEKSKKISELEKQLQEGLEKNNATDRKSNEEVTALKKKLEESSKEITKIRTQHKNKIKDFNKKLESFKKASDTNALIVDLQNENTKLSEKIAELEEEKGNMQLQMVESTDSVKDSTLLEVRKELEDQLLKKNEELDEKEKVISLLEADIISSKEEIKSLNNRISSLSHLENVEVTSEIKSIQIEEQIEKVEMENHKLRQEIEEMVREKEELVMKIEELKKDKQEQTAKLDNYIQENMELIDKLEKLSAEKVSSAESIEIVEGLTQQEKLELAAYQKTLDAHIEGEPIKCTEDDAVEQHAELNESVMQLSEDSTELLQKIDMFTIERKEVMSKLEALKEENGVLNLKIREIENNRDILAETYEQLQNEKEELQNEYEEVVRKLKDMESGGKVGSVKGSSDPELAVKLQELQNEHEHLLTENRELKRILKEYDAQIHEKDNLDAELSKARKKIDELEENIKSNIEDITFYQSVIEENKTELINSANLINDLQTKLNERENDIRDLNLMLNDLNVVVNNLQMENDKLGDFEVMETQVTELKTALNEQIQQAQDYEEEIARNNDLIDDLNRKLVEMNKKILETEHEMEIKDIEVRKSTQDLENKEETIRNLQKQIEERDRKINVVVEDMKQKYLSLQRQLDGNSGSLESKVGELANKNKEQMEKMKKIAANLRKKNQAYQELEAKYGAEKEKWEMEKNEKNSIIADLKDQIASVQRELKDLAAEVEEKTQRLAQSEERTRELKEVIQSLEEDRMELQNSLTELRRKEEKLNEVSLKQELSTSLHEEFDTIPGSKESTNEEKIKELELIIETNQNALSHFTERVHKLEEELARLVQEKETSEKKVEELNEKLNATSKNVEEKELVEEELGHRLAQVTANDEALERKVEEITAENKEIAEKNKQLEEFNYKLKVKVKKAQEKINQLKMLQSNVEELENINQDLQRQLTVLEANQRHIQDENQELRKKSQSDYERIEADYQVQLEESVKIKNELTVDCEKLQEVVKEMQAREDELTGEITEYKQRIEQVEAENKEKVQELSDEIRVANFNWTDSLKEIESLNEIVKNLRSELVIKIAQETVEDVIVEATKKVSSINTVGCQAVVEMKDGHNQRVKDENSASIQTDEVQIDTPRNIDATSIGSQTDSIEIAHSQTDRGESPTDSPIADIHSQINKDRVAFQQTQMIAEAVPTFQWPGSQQHSVENEIWLATSIQGVQSQSSDWSSPQPQTSSNVPPQSGDWFGTQMLGSSNVPLQSQEFPTHVNPVQAADWFGDQTHSSSGLPSQSQEFNWFAATQGESSSNVPQVDLVSQLQLQPPLPVENNKEELLNKIRALEVLLYNVDKEKEEALQECTGMINELTRLLYEKVNAPTTKAVLKTELAASVSGLEGQIVSELDVADASSKKKELHDIEFESTDPSLGEQIRPVVEELAKPKKAYLTYQPDKMEAFGENDDGWGWGPEEAKLDEEHMFKAESMPQVQNLRGEIAQLQEKLRVFQVERENHLEEIRTLQVKSGKLIKKCKELKLQNVKLSTMQQSGSKSESSDFFDLDATIQEELKSQIVQLEKKLKELGTELDREKQEKANILKRVDVLTSANERMVEMKEIQDTEVLRWRRKHEEAQEKLHNYQWGNDGFNEGAKPKEIGENLASINDNDGKKIEELQQTIKELIADNEELQALLDEQRELRLNAEKSKSVSDSAKMEEEYVRLNERIKTLEQELSNKSNDMQALLEEKNALVIKYEELQKELFKNEKYIEEIRAGLTALTAKNEELVRFLADKDKLIKDLQENEKGAIVQQEAAQRISQLENTVSELKDTIANQETFIKDKEAAYNELKSKFEEMYNAKERLSAEVKQLSMELEQQHENYVQLQIQSAEVNGNVRTDIENQQQRYEQLEEASLAKVTLLTDDLVRHKEAYERLQKENAEKIEELNKTNIKFDQLQAEYSQKESELEQLRGQQHSDVEKDTFELSQQKYQLESMITEKDAAISELTNVKMELAEKITVLTNLMEEKEKEYEQAIRETDAKMAQTVAELEQSWMAQVDQRGADIAESWKLHLESVQTEFASIQDKLKYEINDLEEKCNALVNENNELRKNVDAEIRSEVDRISALQQQINDRQHYITELNNKLVEKQNENDALVGKLTMLENENERILKDLSEKEIKLSGINVIIETTQKQFEEKREVVEEMVRILEKNTSWPLSFEKQELLTEFQRQLGLINEKEQEIVKLNQTIYELQTQLTAVSDKDTEIITLKQSIEDQQKQLSALQEKDNEIYQLNKLVEESQQQLMAAHEKDGEILDLNKLVEDLQKEVANVNEKDEEIGRLQNVIEELQKQLGTLQESETEILRLQQIIEEYKLRVDLNQQELLNLQEAQANTNYALEEYRRQLEDYTNAYSALQASLEEKNQLVSSLNQQLQLADSSKNDNNKAVESLQQEIEQSKKDCATLHDSLSEYQQQLFNVTGDLANKSQELENVNQQLAYSQRNFEIQEAELNKLKELLQVKELEYATSIESIKNAQLRELENHYEEVIAGRDLDIANVRNQLEESIKNCQETNERIIVETDIRQQLEEKTKSLEGKVIEQSMSLEEGNKQLAELGGIIEEQVMKIEELKRELFEKSGDYDSLIAEIDIGRKTITQQPAPAVTDVSGPGTSSSKQTLQLQDDDLSEPVNRAELDLALYMLHQRDVRCEELTMELTHLLEERDMLQLRLSNAIREKEDIRRKIADPEDMASPSVLSPSPSTPPSKTSAIFLAASGTELATEPLESPSSAQNLESKLSELKSVGYKKDKTFVDEQQLRRMQQLSIMHQHIQEASKLPPEAAAKLVDASYTLSRDVQSPSKVLLNWLWGRSTPKVNDT